MTAASNSKKKKKGNDTAFLGDGTSALATALNLQGVQSPFKTDQKLEHAIIPHVRHNSSRPFSQAASYSRGDRAHNRPSLPATAQQDDTHRPGSHLGRLQKAKDSRAPDN